METKPNLIQTIERIGKIQIPSRNGRGVKIRCPFHEEKTPSLQIYPDQHWYCFGCNRGGNAYDFVGYLIEGDNWENRDAAMVRRIINITSGERIQFVNIRPEKTQELPEPSNEVKEILRWAAGEFHRRLLQKSGKKGLDYLYSRGYSDEIIEKLCIGYAAPRTLKTGSLRFSVSKRNEYLRYMAEADLIDENGREYFYNRIIFPNFAENGNVVNLIGRDIQPRSNLRYMNLRGLKRQLYLLGISDPSEPVYLTESVSDTVSLRQLGFQGVGVCGTNLSAFMKQSLSPFQKIYIVPQNDDPSFMAAKTWAEGIHRARVLAISYEKEREKDINDIVVKEGILKAKAKIKTAKLMTIEEYTNMIRESSR